MFNYALGMKTYWASDDIYLPICIAQLGIMCVCVCVCGGGVGGPASEKCPLELRH
jgi:hypothetical protein